KVRIMSEQTKTDEAARQQPKADETQQQQTGRQANGQFAKGNLGGPGNPFARQVARVRRMMFEVGTDEELRAVISKLYALAREGNVAAIKLVLAYPIGRPAPAPDPDALDKAELELITATQATVMPAMATVDKLSPPVARALLLGHLQAQAELQSREILQECARRDEGLPVGERKWDSPEVHAAVAMPAVHQIFTDRDPRQPR